jgi:hypothetical protein
MKNVQSRMGERGGRGQSYNDVIVRLASRLLGEARERVLLYRLLVGMRSPQAVAISAHTNIVREMPRRISPPTIRGELNKPVIDIIHPRLVVC